MLENQEFETAPAEQSPMLNAALDYAGRGWKVFPCQPDGKAPITANGYKDGTDDPVQVRRWWTDSPRANIGMALEPSGLVAVDCDTHQTTCEWGTFRVEHGIEDIPTLTQNSASGGLHYIFEAPEGVNYPGHLAKNVDLKHNGYILLEPSTFEGKPYVWHNDDAVAPAPDWLKPKAALSERAMAAPMQTGTDGTSLWAGRALADELADLLAAPEGQRNCALNKAAFSLGQIVAGGSLDEDTVRDRLSAAASGIGLEPGEIAATIDSGLQAGAQTPRGPKEQVSGGGGPIVLTGGQEHKPLTFSVVEFEGKEPAPRKWIVNGFVPDREVTLLYGDGGTGKSLVALQLAVSVALRSKRSLQSWLGRPVIEGGALYIGAEDEQDEMHRRLADMVASEECSWFDLERLRICSLAGEDALLADLDRSGKKLQETPLYQRLDAEIGRYADTKLVVLDTLADMFGGDEINRVQSRLFINMLKKLSIKHDCGLMMLAHPSKSGINTGRGDSGSTAWNGSVRSRLYLEFITTKGDNGTLIVDDPDARKLTAMKMNYGRSGTQITMRFDSGVFKPEAAESGLDKTAAEAKAERVFLKLLEKRDAQGRNVNASGGANYAPKVFEADQDSEGISKKGFRNAMDRLFDKGKLTNEPTSRSTRIAIVHP